MMSRIITDVNKKFVVKNTIKLLSTGATHLKWSTHKADNLVYSDKRK